MSSVGNKTLVIGIAGEILSGKSTATKFFQDRFKAKTFRFSNFINEILDILDLPQTRDNQQLLGVTLKSLYGEDVLSHAIVERMKALNDELILIDGFRKKEEIDNLRQLSNFKLLFIKSPLEQRYARLKERNEKVGEGNATFEEFKVQQHHSADQDLPKLEQYADCVIENTSTVEALEAKLTSFLTESLC